MRIDEWLNSKESLKLSFVKEWFTRFRKSAFYKIKDDDSDTTDLVKLYNEQFIKFIKYKSSFAKNI